jgi:predicted lipid-binding transport protein (Tim44 family)
MKKVLIVLSVLTFLVMLAGESFARAGKGSSSGFRSKPAETQPQQQNINKPQAQTQPMQAMQKPSFLNSGMFRMLVGGLFIGALLSLFMGGEFDFGGMPGLVELLIVVLIFILFLKIVMKLVTRSWQKSNPQYAGSSYSGSGVNSYNQPELLYNTTTSDTSPPTINEKLIKDVATSTFKLLQEAWTKGDLSIVRNLLTDRMYNYLHKQLNELKTQGLKNIVEIVYFQNLDIVEVGGEGENKVVIVQIDAMLRDYTLDRYNNIVEGSKDTPADVKEYWAFVGKGLEWKLDDIRQVQEQ